MTDFTAVKLSQDDVPGTRFSGRTVEEHTNLQLKRWLEVRGLKKTGKLAELMNGKLCFFFSCAAIISGVGDARRSCRIRPFFFVITVRV